jgi:hypothetical protein
LVIRVECANAVFDKKLSQNTFVVRAKLADSESRAKLAQYYERNENLLGCL